MKFVRSAVQSILIYGLMTVIFSCEKIDVPKDTPRCIKKKIRKENDDCLNKVYSYTYNNETVYAFVPSIDCSDATVNVYSEKCDLICQPSGGISGGGDGKCANFYSQVSNEKLIWSK